MIVSFIITSCSQVKEDIFIGCYAEKPDEEPIIKIMKENDGYALYNFDYDNEDWWDKEEDVIFKATTKEEIFNIFKSKTNLIKASIVFKENSGDGEPEIKAGWLHVTPGDDFSDIKATSEYLMFHAFGFLPLYKASCD